MRDIMEKMRDMERRLRDLERASHLARARIGRGGLRVHSGGDIRVEDGGGLVMSGGGEISLDGYALLVAAATVARDNALGSRTATGYGDLGAALSGGSAPAPGPSVTVEVRPSRKLLVLVSANVRIDSPGFGLSAVGVRLSGANTRAPQGTEGITLFEPQVRDITVTGMIALDGLNEGLTTVKMEYSAGGGSSGTADFPVEFRNRCLTVMPL